MDEKQVYAVKFYGDHPAPFKILNYIYHWGFLVTDGKDYNIVYSNHRLCEKNDGCGVRQENYYELIKTHKPIYFFKTNLTEKELLKNLDEFKNKKYNPFTFNCNTFIYKNWKQAPRMQEFHLYFTIVVVLTSLFIIKKWK